MVAFTYKVDWAWSFHSANIWNIDSISIMIRSISKVSTSIASWVRLCSMAFLLVFAYLKIVLKCIGMKLAMRFFYFPFDLCYIHSFCYCLLFYISILFLKIVRFYAFNFLRTTHRIYDLSLSFNHFCSNLYLPFFHGLYSIFSDFLNIMLRWLFFSISYFLIE